MNTPTLAHPAVRRVDPRRPAIITPQGLRRIVLGSTEGERGAARLGSHADAPKPLRSQGPFQSAHVVVSHTERGALGDGARQAVAAAAILAAPGTEVVLVTLGPCKDDAAALGADRILSAGDFDASVYQPEAALAWLQLLQTRLTVSHWLFADHAADGELGRRFAAATGLAASCGVAEIRSAEVRVPLSPTHDAVHPLTPVLLLAKGVASTKLPFVGLGEVAQAPDWRPVQDPQVEDLGLQAGDPQSLALEEADFIAAAGNGVVNVPLFHDLARSLGAAVGASRVAVDDGRFTRAQQVGATGKTVVASTYLALGISGAVQHLQGIKDCRHVIAVNTDASAPISKRADLTVVEDSAALMQALLTLVKHHKEAL
jgi:electron transfer flavoprotein alpha subunit